MYTNLSLLFAGLIVAGTFLTFLLFKFNLSAIREVGLDKKIMMWIPFAVIFLGVLALGTGARLVTFALITGMAIAEYRRVVHISPAPRRALTTYLILFLVGFAHIGLLRLVGPNNSSILTFLIVGTVVSDVCGFFFGNFFGHHKLPEIFNKRKSWEGVLGQVVGALIGVFLVQQLVMHQGNIWLFVPIGIGSALGDLANSYAKRIAGIKNWGESIPGHGGFLDRFCSLAGSALLTFYYIALF